MSSTSPLSAVGTFLAGFWFAIPSVTFACEGSPVIRTATSATIKAFIHAQRRNVVTFVGYSGAGYEAPDAMLAQGVV